jgi:DNA-3-methyladenine glycosylase I
MIEITVGDDGRARCSWGASPEIYVDYHDREWGRPVTDDNRLFEKLCLEGFQSGLSWLTILRKRGNFRAAFAGFDIETVAGFGESEVARLLDDPGIVRHQGKIRSAINNAHQAIAIVDEEGSLSSYFWSRAEPGDPAPSMDAITPTSTMISKDLKRRGWSFVGPTTVYAFMQSVGLVNDHLEGCHVREDCLAARRQVLASDL